ncbi:pre-B-cell leukemia homeobox interacting protein 1b isoform X2 [Pangasianodon hypophthalmus]|uniref:pre-B-cell leukemia homeobox interacting protein 1b isoform X2 n=1 Tax=Pangasianodon hypophthalmus TaxID=310915 RepID=UPI002307F613|nr:pre-B-cell leukemia homeobox interacting protein 1b isoform X2 [Pangasianodon hypophthalmus]
MQQSSQFAEQSHQGAMADNSSTNGNSWTILAPEVKESGVVSMGPLSEGQGELHAEPDLTQSSALSDTSTEQTHPPDPPQVTPLESSEDAAVLHSTTVKEDMASSIPAHVENLTSLTPDPGEQGAFGDDSESQPLIDTESFSDSYTHISPSPVSASLLGTSEEEEGLLQGEEKGELRKTLREECKPEEKVNEGDGLRRRNVSVPTPLYHRDDEEEEEEGEEEQFRQPQREGEGDIGFTLNKCIFGALILLGLGTIFFSEGDADAKDLKYPEVKKEWLSPDAQGDAPEGVQPPKILDKLAKEDQQIVSLQAKLQEQEVELKAAQLQVEEGTKERLRREELEAENQRMRGELDKLPALQKEYEQENERVKRESERVNKELEALPAMQKELEHLREKVMELTQSTVSVQAAMPSAGHEEVPSSQERKERKDKKAWDKQRKEKDLQTEKKEWKKDKNIKLGEQDDKGKSTKDRKELEKEEKQGRRKGEGKNRQKDHKQEDAQRWKLDDEKRELKERSGKREGKEDKKWEKDKHGEFVDRRQEKREKGKDDKERKQKSEQKDWKEEKEWKKGKQASRNEKEWKEKSEKKKDWKERKEWGDEKERGASGDEKYSDKSPKEKIRKGKKDYHNGNSERKEREEKHRGVREKDKPKSGERTEGWKEEKKYKDKKHKREEKMSRKDKHEALHHSYSDQKHSKDHMHVKYWAEQREKIRHYYGSTEGCADVTACAHAEGLAPVSQRDFEAFISSYLMKLVGNEDQTSRKEELSKLIGEFFADGVFVHDQIPFSEFVEDVADILEDMADGDEYEELENEMEGFATEAMEKFGLREKDGNEEKRAGSGRKRMKG